ncbi:MAG: glycosyltransferase [Clostridium sp.]|nr:glycosyltransferase [Prevotella sp.]MCM1429490.1 glycosyltransferase [Clostridium sp.]MCM1476106.1 glycosyltransferase [Muribaculaceae bacterium]
MKILYVSSMSSPRVIDRIHRQTGTNPGYAMQKFNRLVATGLSSNGAEVTALSAPPDTTKLICRYAEDSYRGVKFKYLTTINLPILRHLWLIIATFFSTLFWGLSRRGEKRVVCDVLNVSICIGAVCASKLIGLKACGIVTDIWEQMVGKRPSLKDLIIEKINHSYLGSFSYYIFLTEAMNKLINERHQPYIIMEGLVDSEAVVAEERETADGRHSIIYAGGLYEKYGVGTLISAFLRQKDTDITLDLYGHGEMVEEIKRIANEDPRVKYHGIVPNEEIVSAERRALLLINPRPTDEEFTRYSFPSKNMEYMVSGTPVLTTRLPGMPLEYHEYVYLFDTEDVEGYADVLSEVLSLPREALREKGIKAQEFVLINKNNIAQGKRILEMMKA